MTDKLSERMHKFRVSPWEPRAPETVEEADLMWGQSLEIFEIGVVDLEQRMGGLEEIEQACIKLYVGEITKTEWRHVVRNGPLAKKLVALAEEEA